LVSELSADLSTENAPGKNLPSRINLLDLTIDTAYPDAASPEPAPAYSSIHGFGPYLAKIATFPFIGARSRNSGSRNSHFGLMGSLLRKSRNTAMERVIRRRKTN